MNPGLLDTEVDVIVSAAAAPLTVPLKRDAVVWVQIGGCGEPPAEGCVAVPPDTSYTTTVASDIDKPIVAEQFAFYGKGAVGEGVATLMGTPRPQRGAVFALGGVAPSRSGVLAIANPGAVAVTASVLARARGHRRATGDDARLRDRPRSARRRTTSASCWVRRTARSSSTRPGRSSATRTLYSKGDITRSEAILDDAMTARLVLAIVLVVAAAIVAWVLDRRRKPAPPAQGRATVPQQLDRQDFPRTDAPWLVVLWSSRTCESCQGLFEKLTPLASDDVAVVEVEYQEQPELHKRYAIDAAPITVIVGPRRCDARVVHRFVQRNGPLGRSRRTARLNRGLRVRPRSPRLRTPRCRRRG